MAPIAPAECSPATAPAIFSTPNSTARVLRINRHRATPTTAWSCRTPISAAAIRCAPPDNKPLPAEILNCSGYLEQELDLLRPRVILALGAIAFDTYLRLLVRRGALASRAPYAFAHGAECKLPPPLPRLFASYHPSQQNTQTGRLTPAMFCAVLQRIRQVLAASAEPRPPNSRPRCTLRAGW